MTDPHDRLDDRLRNRAARWREGVQPTPIDVEEVIRRRNPTPAPWLLPLLAAALVVVVVAALGVWLATRGGQAEPAGSPGVVPWKPLPATHPKLPTVSIPAYPSEAHAAELPRCRPGQIIIRPVGMGGAAGTEYVGLRFVLTGRRPCRLQGYPKVQLLDASHPVQVPVERAPSVDSFPGGPVAVTPTSSAFVRIGWSSGNYCGPAKRVDHLQVTLPGFFRATKVPGFGRTFCSPGERVQPVRVQPIEPWHYRFAHRESAYAHVRVSGNLDLTTRQHRPIHFRITLTSPKTLVLAPCPDYTIGEYGPSTDVTHRYALNCAGVPTRDSHGRPVLRAHTPLTFAMRAPAASALVPKFVWWLATPSGKPILNGRLVPAGLSGPRHVAVVHGRLLTSGGLAPGNAHRIRGTVTARSQVSGSVVQTVRTDKSGRFRLSLPPGRYLLTGGSHDLGGPDRCVGDAVNLGNGDSVVRDLYCPIR